MFDRLPKRRNRETLVSRVGRAIADAREFVGLSQVELAKRSGVSARTIAYIESGRGDCLLSTLDRLAPHLDLYVCDLLQVAEDEDAA